MFFSSGDNATPAGMSQGVEAQRDQPLDIRWSEAMKKETTKFFKKLVFYK